MTPTEPLVLSCDTLYSLELVESHIGQNTLIGDWQSDDSATYEQSVSEIQDQLSHVESQYSALSGGAIRRASQAPNHDPATALSTFHSVCSQLLREGEADLTVYVEPVLKLRDDLAAAVMKVEHKRDDDAQKQGGRGVGGPEGHVRGAMYGVQEISKL